MGDFADSSVSLQGLGARTGTARSTVSSGIASVSVGGETVSLNVARGLTLASGDQVVMSRVGSLWIVTSLLGTGTPSASTAPDIEKPPPAKPATPITGTLVVVPVETRSYRTGSFAGWRTDNTDVYQGQYGGLGNHTGCAFYGSKPRSLAGATVTSATIRVRRDRAGDFAKQTATLRLVTQATRPAGTPTLTSSTTGPRLAIGATDNSFTVPTSWVQAMVDGTAGGLAVFDSGGSPYMRFAGKGSWSAAWQLTIRYTR